MDLGLKGKAAVVTGGSRGIGRAIADLLADEGCDVAICARNADQGPRRSPRSRLRAFAPVGQSVDIADGPALKAFVTQAGTSWAASTSWSPTPAP